MTASTLATSEGSAAPAMATSRLEQLVRLRHLLAPAQVAAGICLFGYVRLCEVSSAERAAVMALAAALVASAVAAAWSGSRWIAAGSLAAVVTASAYFVARIDAVHLVRAERFVKVGLALSLAAWLFAWVLHYLLRARVLNAAMFSYSVALVLLAGEYVAPQLRPEFDIARKQRQKELGGHPILGWINQPGGSISLNFPDNPRGYFYSFGTGSRLDMRRWGHMTFPGSSMEVTFPQEREGALRAVMKSPPSANPVNCNLTQAPFSLQGGKEYHLTFRARADRPRTVRVDCSQSHDPWGSLGLAETIALTPDWQEFRYAFTAAQDDANARVKFDVGSSDVPLELADVQFDATSLMEGPDGAKFFIETPVNEIGFRGPVPPQDKPPGVFRIIGVGDSFTFGYGVKEPDVFLAVLERRLNEAPKPPGIDRYEVVNFGVCGYGTPQERRCYELYARKWHPDLVILSMVHNDNLTDEADLLMSIRGPNAWEKTFYLARWAREPFLPIYRTAFDGCIPEVLALRDACRRDGAPLVVNIFRHQRQPQWEELAATMKEGLQDTGIPLIDMGEVLLAEGAPQDLLVHERVDSHPNEIAHRITAEQLDRFLHEKNLLGQRSQPQNLSQNPL